MVSRTKYEVDAATIEKLFKAAGLGGVSGIASLGAGEYNAVYAVTAGEKACVLKIAPLPSVPVLSYEKDMMAAEVFWYDQMRRNTTIRVPQVYHADFSRQLIPCDYFIMEKLEGAQLDKMDLTAAEKADSVAQMAQMAAQLHRIKNDGFGYRQNGLHGSWYEAIKAMAQAVLADAARKGKRSRRGEKLLHHIERHRAVLEAAECCMVNFDIWPPNILCRRTEGGIEYAWIDPERSFWGDALADFVCLETMAPLAGKTASLKAYNAVAQTPVGTGPRQQIRHAVAVGYLGLLMEVEKYYRYSPRHKGWWRNVLASKLYFGKAFGVLGHG